MEKKEKRRWERLAAAGFLVFLLGVALLSAILPDREVSVSERRRLAKLPELSAEAVWNGSYAQEMETYLEEQLAGREIFRRIRAWFLTDILQKADVDGYYEVCGSLSKLEPELKEKNVLRAAENFVRIADTYFPEADAYYAIIPDKNYFLAEQNGYPALDYARLNACMSENMGDVVYIDLYEKLDVTDYYRTDLHWRQECIGYAADALLAGMGKTGADSGNSSATDGVKEPASPDYETVLVSDAFYGGYAGASAMDVEPDTLYCLTSETLSQVTVYDYEKQSYVSLYAPEAAEGMDPYDVYLWGARALLRIENPTNQDGERILIFRDSFGSSMAPLLVEPYAEVTLVDLRYVSLDYAMQLLEPDSYDAILFLYSVPLLNHSDSLRF